MVTTKIKIVMFVMILVGVAFAAYWILGYSSEQNIMESLKLCKFVTDMGAAEIAVIFSSVI